MEDIDAVAQSNKQALLTYLKEKGIEYELHSHPKVLTVEEAAKYTGQLEGGHSKNIFLKDKKNRLVVVSALPATKLDLKSLSQRLGLGKSGLRMAPEESLQTVLQVPPGCVTPFCLFNQTAREVGLLLDSGFQAHAKIYFHPLCNDATIGVTPSALGTFLQSLGQDPAFVDLEADLVVGKDQPPDLAKFLSSVAPGLATSAAGAALDAPPVPSSKATSAPAVPKAKSKGSAEVASPPARTAKLDAPAGDDVNVCCDAVLDLISSFLPQTAEAAADSTSSSPLPAGVRKNLEPDLRHLLVMFKNAAYTQGFTSAIASQRRAG